MADSNLVDRIYECAFVPELWPDVLDELAAIGGAVGGLLFAGTFEKVLYWTSSESVREPAAEFANSDLVKTSQRLPRLLGAGNTGFVGDLDLYREEELHYDPAYRDFLWPKGLGWAAGTALALPTGDALSLSLERTRASGPPSVETLQKLDLLRPHIARSAFLAARQQLTRAQAASDTLALIGLPAIVMNKAGKVLAANRLANELAEHLRWGAADRVSIKDPGADQNLKNAIATIDSERDMPVRSFVIRDLDLRAVMVAHVLPLRGTACDIFVQCSAVLVMTPVAMPKAPPVELVQSLFDLTPAEARVARKLVAGNTLEDIATESGVSRETIRTQMRGVFGKTSCSRQAELVALLSGVALPGQKT